MTGVERFPERSQVPTPSKKDAAVLERAGRRKSKASRSTPCCVAPFFKSLRLQKQEAGSSALNSGRRNLRNGSMVCLPCQRCQTKRLAERTFTRGKMSGGKSVSGCYQRSPES